MPNTEHKPQVGAPDPELKTSPIFDDADLDSFSMDAEMEEGFCYFNSEVFRLGDFVCSGNELLRCEDRGIWIREGSCYEK